MANILDLYHLNLVFYSLENQTLVGELEGWDIDKDTDKNVVMGKFKQTLTNILGQRV